MTAVIVTTDATQTTQKGTVQGSLHTLTPTMQIAETGATDSKEALNNFTLISTAKEKSIQGQGSL